MTWIGNDLVVLWDIPEPNQAIELHWTDRKAEPNQAIRFQWTERKPMKKSYEFTEQDIKQALESWLRQKENLTNHSVNVTLEYSPPADPGHYAGGSATITATAEVKDISSSQR